MKRRRCGGKKQLLCVSLMSLVSTGFLYYLLLHSDDDYDVEPPEFVQFDRVFLDEDRCKIFPLDVNETHPLCMEKLEWLKEGYRSHWCYKKYGVNGSFCSLRNYLSFVEPFCPYVDVKYKKNVEVAQIVTNVTQVLEMMTDVPTNYLYIQSRIKNFWSEWMEGLERVERKNYRLFEKRRKKNILIFIGLLARESSINFAKLSGKGGPLGELVQWSDLIASLGIAGHSLHIVSSEQSLVKKIRKFDQPTPCPRYSATGEGQLDLIFTDIMGLRFFRKHANFMVQNKCKVRLLDSFGTHAEFSSKSYFRNNKQNLSGNSTSTNPWGGHGLKLKQHWTFFPHTPDNSFLGFVVSKRMPKQMFTRESRNSSLVYGKESYMWSKQEKSLRVLSEMTEVHSTVENTSNTNIFDNITNHGFLERADYDALLSSVKIFFGMGFPLEGPAPLEAIARGAVFINARFSSPKSRLNSPFLGDKPTLREFSSQCPYLEDIGEPYVHTVDIENENELREAISKALRVKPKRIVPEEFTAGGMLLRVTALTEKQDFCREKRRKSEIWPPLSAMILRLSNPGTSCESCCKQENMVCEPEFFPIINEEILVKRKMNCTTTMQQSNTGAPFNCVRQKESHLFSCASKPPSISDVRLCPCRRYLPQQHELCITCI